MSTSHIDRNRFSSHTSACAAAACVFGGQLIGTALPGVPGEAAASLHRAVETESREKAMVKLAHVDVLLGAQPGEIRESVVESVVAGLQAAQLSVAEYHAVVGAIHGELMLAAGTTLEVSVSALRGLGRGQLSTELQAVGVQSAFPLTALETVVELVRQASPELLAEMLGVLRASDAELAARVRPA